METFWKPARGSYVLEREKNRAEAADIERKAKAKAKRRDGRCRWPEPHKCLGGLESAHIVDASLGGAMATENLVTLCAWLHRRGPESIHGKHIKIEKETTDGADGALSFWRRLLSGEWYLVARERSPFILERD